MHLDIPRLRMFAGPNGSGKSTMKTDQMPAWFKQALWDKFP